MTMNQMKSSAFQMAAMLLEHHRAYFAKDSRMQRYMDAMRQRKITDKELLKRARRGFEIQAWIIDKRAAAGVYSAHGWLGTIQVVYAAYIISETYDIRYYNAMLRAAKISATIREDFYDDTLLEKIQNIRDQWIF